MLYMIIQSDWEPVLIQRILIGFEAILEIYLPSLVQSAIGSIMTAQSSVELFSLAKIIHKINHYYNCTFCIKTQ